MVELLLLTINGILLLAGALTYCLVDLNNHREKISEENTNQNNDTNIHLLLPTTTARCSRNKETEDHVIDETTFSAVNEIILWELQSTIQPKIDALDDDVSKMILLEWIKSIRVDSVAKQKKRWRREMCSNGFQFILLPPILKAFYSARRKHI